VPDAVEVARAIRRSKPNGQRVEIAGTDPLNLTGIVTPGVRVPAVLGQKVVYVDGVPRSAESVDVDGGSALAS
jgi:ATP-dependent helicase Lhr and Lhr-like helicase